MPGSAVGRPPWAAAGPLAGLVHLPESVRPGQGARRGPGGPPHIYRGGDGSVNRGSAPLRSRFGGAAVAVLLALPLLAQDDVWFVEVTAPQSYVLCGRVLQLEARATSAAGAPTDAGIGWRSSNPTIADVDESGRVRGLLPGEAVIEAVHGNVSGRLVLQVQPARIRLEPADLDLETGQQTRFTARALDADGAAIPGVRFVWTSGVPAVASVDGGGAVTGLAEGAVTVTALLDIPDLGFGFSAQARVRVRARTPFRSTRVVASDSQTRPVTLRRIDDQSAAGDRSAFTAVLSNGSYALMLADNAGVRPLAVNGDFFEPTAQVITGFGGVTMNASGDVVARISFATAGWGLVRFPLSGAPELVAVPSEFAGSGEVSTRSLGPNGELLFRGWNNRGQYILYRRPDGRVDRVATQNDPIPIPGFGTANWFGDLTAPVNGKAIFMGYGANRTALLEWDGRAVRKLVATGDPIFGRTVQWLDSPVLTSSGDVYLRIGGDNYSQIVRLSGSQWSNVVQAGQPLAGGATVQWIDSLRDARGPTVVFSGGSDRGNGLFRYDGATFEILARYGGAADEWRWIEYAALDSRGGVFARGTSGNFPTRLARVGSGGSPVVLAETGRSLDLTAGAGLEWNLLGGSNAGVPVFLSSARGLVRAEAGRADPVLVHGDSLPEGETLFWTGAFAANRSGEFAFKAGSPRGEAIYLWRNGRLTRLIQNWDGARVPGGNIRWFDWAMAVNTRGQVVVYVHYDGGDGLFLFAEGAAPRTIALEGSPAPGGGVLRGLGPVAIDDRGRVAFFADTGSGSQVLFYWDNGQLRRLRQIGDNGITSFDTWRFQAAGDRIYVFTRFGNAQEISAYDGASWRPAVTESPYGICSTWYSAASNGDVLYYACLPDGVSGPVVRKPDGRDILVAATGQRSADGDWFVQILTWVLSEQGDVFFAAVTPAGPKDRITLFRATPQ